MIGDDDELTLDRAMLEEGHECARKALSHMQLQFSRRPNPMQIISFYAGMVSHIIDLCADDTTLTPKETVQVMISLLESLEEAMEQRERRTACPT